MRSLALVACCAALFQSAELAVAASPLNGTAVSSPANEAANGVAGANRTANGALNAAGQAAQGTAHGVASAPGQAIDAAQGLVSGAANGAGQAVSDANKSANGLAKGLADDNGPPAQLPPVTAPPAPSPGSVVAVPPAVTPPPTNTPAPVDQVISPPTNPQATSPPPGTRDQRRPRGRRRAVRAQTGAGPGSSGGPSRPQLLHQRALGQRTAAPTTLAAAPKPRRQQRARPVLPGASPAANPVKLADAPIISLLHELPLALAWTIAALAGLAFALSLRSYLFRRGALERTRALEDDIGTLQSVLLPEVAGSYDGLDVSVAYRPAEGPGAGGDFFDVFELPDGRLAALIGDVSGHGREALRQTAAIHFGLRALLKRLGDPAEALARAAQAFADDLDGNFATVCCAIIDRRRGELVWSCAGHEPPLVLGTDQQPVIAASQPPLGVDVPEHRRRSRIMLPPGATVCLYTDGLSEARRDERLLGVGGVRSELEALPRSAGAPQLLDAIARPGTRIGDDMAAVMIRCPSAAPQRQSSLAEEIEAPPALAALVAQFARRCGLDPAASDAIAASVARADGRQRVTIGSGGEVELAAAHSRSVG